MLDLFFAAVISAADPTVVAQATTPVTSTTAGQSSEAGSGAVRQSHNYATTFTTCQDVENLRQFSANNSFGPIPEELTKLWGSEGGEVYTPARMAELGLKISVLEMPKHGKLVYMDPPGKPKGMLPAGSTSFHYMFQPDKNYLGKDRVVYEIEAQGKKYKVTINFWVVPVVAPEPMKGDTPRCLDQKFDGSTLDPSLLNGPSGYIITGYSYGSLPLGDDTVNVTFGDLPGNAPGQTIGNTITLDTNAAGNGWFLNTTGTMRTPVP